MGEIGLSVLIALVALVIGVPVGHRVVAGVPPPDGGEPRRAAPGAAALGRRPWGSGRRRWWPR
ncbi:hypothetical protein [Candidatus Frankia alpina]|uniref:hypothetical protein n=1 Tax=Candidatus Frankia alpina TaxID=2699483 RepID=UPI001F1F59C2|nr:hypothetical protein [Candidatus Frankia alpina]